MSSQPSSPLRKKSPRAPSLSLDDALDRALRIYDKQRLHPGPTDVVAQHMGYKSANNGQALGALASLRYYGLLERPQDGMYVVTKAVESYKYAPEEEMKRALLWRFLTSPPLFADLLERYQGDMPADANLRYELISRGFLPGTAESVVGILKKSLAFVGMSAPTPEANVAPVESTASAPSVRLPHLKLPSLSPLVPPLPLPPQVPPGHGNQTFESPESVNDEIDVVAAKQAFVRTSSEDDNTRTVVDDADHDRIPVRLSGGRRAWLVIPTVFKEADKARLKAQIDLILTQEDEDDD